MTSTPATSRVEKRLALLLYHERTAEIPSSGSLRDSDIPYRDGDVVPPRRVHHPLNYV
jgi:hypothetical protein